MVKSTKRKSDSDDEGDELAKTMFMKKYAQPMQAMRTVRTGGASLPTITAEGVIVRADIVSRGGVPKLECQIDVHSIRSNGAFDLLSSGVGGIDFLLPTQKPSGPAADGPDDSPEGGKPLAKKGKKTAGPPRALKLEPNHKTIWAGSLPRVGFYTTARSEGGKEETKEGTQLLVVGMPVEVCGVVANLDDKGSLWLNASSCTARLDGIVDGTAPETIIAFGLKPNAMEKNAILWSQTMRGFFGATNLKPEHEVQANFFRSKWAAARDGIVAACDAKAVALRSELGGNGGGNGDAGDAAARVMEEHATRLRATNPADLANGTPFFNDKMPPSPEWPTFQANVVHDIVSMDFPQQKLLFGLFDKSTRDNLPETFCAPQVHSAEVNGNVLLVKLKLHFVGSKAAAIQSIKNDHVDPTLDTGALASVGLKFNMRKEMPEVTGVVHLAKAQDLCPDIFKFGRWSALGGVVPREPLDDALVHPFSSGNVDMFNTLQNISVLVDEPFIKEYLAGGANQYAYERDPDVAVILQADGISPVSVLQPSLKKNNYQEITGSTFKFDNAKMPLDRQNKQYRVWFAGVTSSILEDTDLLVDSEKGKALVMEAAVGENLADFILARCCVYVLATE